MDVKNDTNKQMLEFELPPIWPDIRTELREYIECLDNLPIYHLDNAQCYWPRKPDILSLLNCDIAPLGTTLKFNRDPVTGKLGEMHEVPLKSAGETARNSMSMTRAPGPPSDIIRGNTSNIPFWPGGFDEPEMIVDSLIEEIDFENNLRTLAKGFSAGIEFKSDNYTPKEKTIQEQESLESERNEIESTADKINLMAIVEEEQNELDFWKFETKKIKEETKTKTSDISESAFDEITSLLEERDIPILNISEKRVETITEWAEQLDVSVPLTDFEKRIPELAMSFPYELDIFQKQAILKLEEGCNVFVAAHTSAGKTTVAEYAIALSQKHMTKVIYTSPIKALSNQKYRELKRKFESVGLLTGDLQINPNASCLIITTEILQSMLYCASEVLRDLEFVIFDEVHYINNDERGHVWEESVILLPQTVTIVMLSATVPNPLVFADWVGRTKKKKTYVISTLKRPVPLQHYLYTGTDGKTKDDKFLVLGESGQFLLDGWYKATNSKNSKNQVNKNIKDVKKISIHQQMTPKQEQVLWSAFISHLKTQNMLPVVVFMLSRKRCDMSAVLLRNVDLTTETEKHTIRAFFQNNIRHLKGTDRQLPQVLMMQELLESGIGIHHSGILPILKEIVEMLFQTGVVKLLFATETFAMGVNMPARTVVFDSIKKYDGNNFRILYPSEYVQMAGRAGRRGHDTTGMVIIMCRTSVPHFNELKNMMCGQAQNLESKFKVTYSMVLNLRRLNESVTVEAMMRRSFKESPVVINQNNYKMQLQEVENELSKLPPLTDLQKKLSDFYRVAVDYLEYLKYLKPYFYETQKKAVKSLTPGRILLISYESHYNKLALLLGTVQNKGNRQYRVLVLKNSDISKTIKEIEEKNQKINKSDKWYNIVALTKKEIFIPVGIPSDEVLTIDAWNILEITNCQIKIDYNLVLANWEKRQIPRFKNEEPSQTYKTAMQELMTLSLNASHNSSILKPYLEMKMNYDVDRKLQHLFDLKKAVYDMKCREILNFEEQFEIVYERSELESKKNKLQLKLSDEGLSLYPEYTNAVALLKDLGYIDNDERVALKGRVALQMGNNELLITELILKNVLTVLQPAEIAALLSALIFQQRTDVEPNLTPELKRSCEEIKEIHAELEALEQHYQLVTLQPLNFGLVEVVYDWAQAKSFAEIMEKTDVQEGIIVRCIQQLSETLRDVKNAATTIGDPVLKEKMEEASTVIKRDIVFAASLYTQN
ncbi:helicase SKI2W [Apis mellifera caucasica]|uniref:Helicase SKI2W n=1 Tax=Apis mellifera TaxID=7460 RepID=A0A7M7R776_APIME|nr:helicase SKI2W [Apis mellifera]KAG6800914.1 helicase SKI2W [Apis mellifera caucasica]|eukprot:XP_397131.4 helicase SKI2W [Apis mellifera]